MKSVLRSQTRIRNDKETRRADQDSSKAGDSNQQSHPVQRGSEEERNRRQRNSQNCAKAILAHEILINRIHGPVANQAKATNTLAGRVTENENAVNELRACKI